MRLRLRAAHDGQLIVPPELPPTVVADTFIRSDGVTTTLDYRSF